MTDVISSIYNLANLNHKGKMLQGIFVSWRIYKFGVGGYIKLDIYIELGVLHSEQTDVLCPHGYSSYRLKGLSQVDQPLTNISAIQIQKMNQNESKKLSLNHKYIFNFKSGQGRLLNIPNGFSLSSRQNTDFCTWHAYVLRPKSLAVQDKLT